MKYNFISYIVVLSIGLISCEPEFNNPVKDSSIASQTSGTADFSTYVALGNSLTAGFADRALYIDGQAAAFPAIISQQMAAAGGGEFTIPFMNDNIGGFTDIIGETNFNDDFGKRLVFNVGTNSPENIDGKSSTLFTNIIPGPYNNMGVPGAKSFHLGSNTYGNLQALALGAANPYFIRMASAPNTTVIADALMQQPTFFSLWIGNNDVLSYATSGGSGVNQLGNLNPATYGSNDITDSKVFANVYSKVIDALTLNPKNGERNNVKGIINNIPSVTSLPFFNTVPFNPIPLDAVTANAINTSATIVGYNKGLQQALELNAISAAEVSRRTLNFTAGQNAPIIIDENLTDLASINPAFNLLPQLRQASPQDLFVLTSSTFIGTLADPSNPNSVNGIGVPLSDKWVLTLEEQSEIETATTAFNTAIETIAISKGLAFYDVNSRLIELSSGGISVDGAKFTNSFVRGGFFSLDGVHITPRGNALIANEMIEIINETYKSSLQPVDLGSFPTVRLN